MPPVGSGVAKPHNALTNPSDVTGISGAKTVFVTDSVIPNGRLGAE